MIHDGNWLSPALWQSLRENFTARVPALLGRWEVGGGAISSTTMRFVHYLGPLELLSQVRVPLATSSHPPGEPSVTGVIYHMREILAFKLFFSAVKSNTGTHTHE